MHPFFQQIQNCRNEKYINRSLINLITHTLFLKELNIRQILINNRFPNFIVNEQIKNNKNNRNNIPQNNHNKNSNTIKLFYCNQMRLNYKQDEIVIKNIIRGNI